MLIWRRIIKFMIIVAICQGYVNSEDPADNTASTDSDTSAGVPSTTDPSTTVPSTTVPSTTVPSTTVPSTTDPSTTVPSTTVPSTTVPSTTVPSTTVPSTTVPSGQTPLTPSNQTILPTNNTDLPSNSTSNTTNPANPANTTNTTNTTGTTNTTDTPTTTPTAELNIGSSQTLAGSFLQNAMLYSSNLPNTSTLEFVFVLSLPGVNRPDVIKQGGFNLNNTSAPSEDEEEIQDDSQFKDMFGAKWEQSSDNMESYGLNETETISQNIKDLYSKKNTFLNLNDTSEIVFIALDRQAHVMYTKYLLAKVYPALKNNFIAEAAFTFANYNNTEYNPTVSATSGNQKIPKVARLQDDYATFEMGFSYGKYCSKVNTWKRNANYDIDLMIHLAYNFEDVFDTWKEAFEQPGYGPVFYDYKNKPYLYLDEKSLFTNLTLNSILIYSLTADLVRFADDEILMDQLNQFIPNNNNERINDLKKFFLYEYSLYSDLYNYLTISPFLNFMIQQFNVKIKNDTSNPSYKNKIAYFCLNDISIGSIYKAMLYDYKKKNNIRYKEMPYITFGFSVQFELWKNVTKTGNNYYVVMREKFSDKPVFVLTSRNFAVLIQTILIVPDFTRKEREFYCGKVVSK